MGGGGSKQRGCCEVPLLILQKVLELGCPF